MGEDKDDDSLTGERGWRSRRERQRQGCRPIRSLDFDRAAINDDDKALPHWLNHDLANANDDDEDNENRNEDDDEDNIYVFMGHSKIAEIHRMHQSCENNEDDEDNHVEIIFMHLWDIQDCRNALRRQGSLMGLKITNTLEG